MTSAGSTSGSLRVRFPTHPHSVRSARHLVADALRAWGLPLLVDDACLVVTELCTNATLHSGASWFWVSADVTSPGSVRLAVSDEGRVPAAAIVRRREQLRADPASGLRSQATTGRGLAIVDELSSAWGVESDDGTTQVWAELSTPTSDVRAARVVSTPTAPGAAAAAADQPLPPGWHLVRLVDCPVLLSMAQDDHLDELVRELQLVEPSGDDPELAPVIRGLLDGQAAARHTGRRTAQDAASVGLEHVTVEMLLPTRGAEDVRLLDEAVIAADALCERQQLLTLASSPEVRRLRRWMREELRDQIVEGRPPRPWADFLAAEQSPPPHRRRAAPEQADSP